jgi:hypothetical protein
MDFRVENFISPDRLQVLSKTGLHKTAAVLNGIEEMTIKHAVAILGSKAHQRRLEYRSINNGIRALGELRGEKVAVQMPHVGNWMPHIAKGIPAALLGGGIGYMLAPNDPEAEKKYMMNAGLMGLLGGTLNSVNKAI